ncbi:MAG: hypothetical protein HYY17_11995 [Planctomycetes bacterium]|nr:hypothetical protein [Planctomycetota bacterium]
MGKYLTADQIGRVSEELCLVYSLPYLKELPGTAWEQILASVKGGKWTGLRDNRARPDFCVQGGKSAVNFSVKTESLRFTKRRKSARDFLGCWEDLIVARPKVDELLAHGESVGSLSAGELGAKVLEYYNTHIVRKFEWHVISVLLRLEGAEEKQFIYWEESPPAIYDPDGYEWRESGKATGTNRNINGFPKASGPPETVRAKFKWTSGGKQFYILYRIPEDADIWTVEPVKLGTDEVRNALRHWLKLKKQDEGGDLAT